MSAPLALAHDQRLVLESVGDAAPGVLKLVAADGRVCLTVRVTPDGPVLEFGGSLGIHAVGDLAMSANRIALHAREGIAVSTDGDLALHATGDLHSTARIQNITADLGNVNVKANDDVKINGERVLVNC